MTEDSKHGAKTRISSIKIYHTIPPGMRKLRIFSGSLKFYDFRIKSLIFYHPSNSYDFHLISQYANIHLPNYEYTNAEKDYMLSKNKF